MRQRRRAEGALGGADSVWMASFSYRHIVSSYERLASFEVLSDPLLLHPDFRKKMPPHPASPPI